MMKRSLLSLLFILSLLFQSCDIYEQDEFEEVVVLETYAIANRPLPEVRLSTNNPVDEEYNFQDAALSDGNVTLTLLNKDGNDEEVYVYSLRTAGTYQPENRSAKVLPGRTYRIDITFNNRPEIITAETTVPRQFEIINDVEDSYVYQSENQLELILTATESNAKQNVYVFNTLTRQPSLENLTPFYRNSVEDGDSELSDFLDNSSGLINEGNFEIREDQTILLRFPWIGVAFYGENAVVTNSVDQNLTDLIRSQELQLGGSTLPPGEIPNLIYNVDGGIGIFGSLATDTVITRFVRGE